MEDEEIKFVMDLFKSETGIVGALAGIATGVFFLIKLLRGLTNILKTFISEKIFEKYNKKIKFVYEKSTTYKFNTIVLKKDSQEIFETMRYIYDLEAVVNISSKKILFKMQEIPDDRILFSNITRFLDYYKSKNGVSILISLHQPQDPLSGVRGKLIEYIENSGIHGIKIL